MAAPLLPLAVRGIELPDQLRDTGRALTLRGLLQQQQIDSMQMRAYQEQQAREAQIDALIDNSPMDPMQKALLKSPAGKKALAERIFATQKQAEPFTLGPGQRRYGPGGELVAEVPAEPKADAQTPLGKLIAERDALPPGDPRRAVYDQAIAKSTTHQPPVSVSYGAPVAAELPTGERVFIQPTKGDQPPKVIEGVRPPKPASEVKAEQETKEAKAKALVGLRSSQEKADAVIGKVDEALGQLGVTTTGMIGKGVSRVPGTPAYNLGQTIDTIKANLGFQELATMRAASPTGGALGQIAVRELEFLQAAVASLDLGQGEAQLRRNLQAVRQHFQKWKWATEQAYTEQYGSIPSGATGSFKVLGIEE